MGQHSLRVRSVVTAVLVGAVLLLWSGVSFAVTPTLDADCGSGASIVGTDSGGKVTMGWNVDIACTLHFSVPQVKAPACFATNETSQGEGASPTGARSSTTTLVLDSIQTANYVNGDVVSYVCFNY